MKLAELPILLRYLRVVAVHKWAIVAAGLRVNRTIASSGLRVSLRRLLVHDLSKLSRAELMPYARHFATASGARAAGDEFARAWQHHYRHNDHHPEHFIGDDGEVAAMPDEAVVEMVVDWMAASRAYEGTWPCCGGHWRWLEHAWDRLPVHPDNKALAGAIVCALGYAVAVPEYDWTAPDVPDQTRAQIAALRGFVTQPA